MTPINLETTVFELGEVVQNLPMTKAFKGKELIQVVDFGTVFQGELSPSDKEMSLPQEGAPIFTIPLEWKMCHVLAKLGAFPSVTQARKNGWDKEIPKGCTSILFRIKKIRGELWLHRGE